MTRRQLIATGGAGLLAATHDAAAQSAPEKTIPASVIAAHDKGVDNLLGRQVTDSSSKYQGAFPDSNGLYYPGSSGGLIDSFTSAFVTKGSKHHQNGLLLDRIGMAVDFVTRGLSPDGNIYLPTTNFNSPPDTAFFSLNLAAAAYYARKFEASEISKRLEPLIKKNAEALIKGGVHTPNHRWVACAAMAQIHALYPDPRLIRRIDQWLAEGIDINEDGQYSEQSVGGYSQICDRSFVVLAHKLKRPELLDPVRRNLNSLLYLLHPDHDVVTEVSVRQDRGMRVSAGIYYFPLKYMAVHDNNGQYEELVRLTDAKPWLGGLIEYPQLMNEVTPAPIPIDYEKQFSALGITRLRRGRTSLTLHHKGNDRFLSFRRGDAVVEAVRFASAFFGKGQFIPQRMERRDGGYYLEQTLQGPYYQPLDDPSMRRIVVHDEWSASRALRRQTEVSTLTQSAFLKEEKNGLTLRLSATGTREVPVAVEIGFAAGGQLSGCDALRPEVHLLSSGEATYRAGKDTIRFGPGHKEHTYVDVRGALPRLPGTGVFLTGTTPFDQTIRFEWA